MEWQEIEAALQGLLDSGNRHAWLADERVWFDGEWIEFVASFDPCDADLLATEVRTHAEDPGWHRWASLHAPDGPPTEGERVAALLPLMRVTRAAAAAVLNGVRDGWTGHPECLIPTLVKRAGLNIEDIGGTGSFTPPERRGRWYDRRTLHWKGPVEHVPGKIHFPVPVHDKPLAAGRVEDGRMDADDSETKILYVSPVGGEAADLLPAVLDVFQRAGADCRLLQYDDTGWRLPDGVRVVRDKGHKWQLALKHLHPDAVDDYDFIYFWDDDLGVEDFDPRRFTRIMRTNRLAMAQPAIQSPHGLSHAITKHRPCPPPCRDGDREVPYRVVGRMTNFVEIMAPVFTREAWREFYSYLDPDNRSGWGYDYIPLGRKGIIDVMPVVHTRPVQSINAASEAEIRRFLDRQGLFRYAPLEMGWLFEPLAVSR